MTTDEKFDLLLSKLDKVDNLLVKINKNYSINLCNFQLKS